MTISKSAELVAGVKRAVIVERASGRDSALQELALELAQRHEYLLAQTLLVERALHDVIKAGER